MHSKFVLQNGAFRHLKCGSIYFLVHYMEMGG